ncbi:linker for activation of T-cells family member 1 isoform X1 [Carassius gibelio]|uniref:linker for activation of T-cells family member 1 isoform X1 n=1 Tax=Carassius gibelio TaxID=101364 RepID=UPI00227903BE|nr:linker for activation of T-cells family member 1 isoform X1 [Carassius gibelio]XP_052406259.1 linker for activation of T-cells family member 1 isoform X1 [Carassius gibelio]XP_052406260.1 linker for activation of T-cells family member 1 isoform X1 [Carassius gibelio]
MDSTALLSVVGGAVFLSIILVTSLCTYCWGHKQPTSIHQRSSDSEYNPTPGFVFRQHPVSTYEHHTDHTRIGPYQPNSLSSPSITVTKVPSCPPSETGSQASYVNQNGEEGINIHVDGHESDDEPYVQPPSEYIVVLPDSPNTLSQRPSRASSQSSGERYINVKNENASEVTFGCEMYVDESDSDIPDYENCKDSQVHRKQTYSLSLGSQSSDERESSDYVNTDPKLQ